MIKRRVFLAKHVAAIRATPTPGQKNFIPEFKLDLFLWHQNHLIDLMIHRTCQAGQTSLPLNRGADHLMAKIPRAERIYLPDNLQDLHLIDL